MKTKPYYPIRGAVISMLLAGLYYIAVSAVVSLVVSDANSILSELIRIISLVPLLLLYKIWHRKELPHLFGIAGTARGVLLGWSMLLMGAIVAVSNLLQGDVGSIPYAFFAGFVPGFSEEVIFRVLPLSLVFQRSQEPKELMKVSLIISLCFGLLHGGNLLIGAELISTLLQVLYAIGIGMLLSGIYLKTGSFWPCIILHTWVDAASSISKSLQESSGVLTRTHTTLEIIILCAFTIAFYVNALMVFKAKKTYEEGGGDSNPAA